ncbi:hypothetical protein SDC9_150557 [bioreactor metagenome]|uniref:Uncharacterized protein n=1 Tax=bioreactor metagenome TaxID=1076179 RepID=A0A645EPQ0_9ZZZZ
MRQKLDDCTGLLKTAVVGLAVRRHLIRRFGKEHLNRKSLFAELSGNDLAIAAVIAWTADHTDQHILLQRAFNHPGTLGTGFFHQINSTDTGSNCFLVHLCHFLWRYHLHFSPLFFIDPPACKL